MLSESSFTFLNYLTWLGEEAKMDTFEERIKFQKIVYLLQAFGIKLRYHFSWYFHGPYSSALADDGFAMENLTDQVRKKLSNTEKVQDEVSILVEVKKFIQQLRNRTPDLADYERFELAASLHFIAIRALRDKNAWKESILELTSQKPKFKRKDGRKIWDVLKEVRLL